SLPINLPSKADSLTTLWNRLQNFALQNIAGSGNPITPQKETKIVCQFPKEKEKRKTVSCRPISGCPSQSPSAGLQLLLEESGHMRSHFVCKRKLFHPSPIIVILGPL